MFGALLVCLLLARSLLASETHVGQLRHLRTDQLPLQADVLEGVTPTQTDGIRQLTIATPRDFAPLNRDDSVHVIAAEECKSNVNRHITGTTGTLYLMNLNHKIINQKENVTHQTLSECIIFFEVPKGYFMNLTVEMSLHLSCSDVGVLFGEGTDSSADCHKEWHRCWYGDTNEIFSTSNSVNVRVYPKSKKQIPIGTPWVVLHFAAVPVSLRHVLPIVHTSPTSGYIASYHSSQPKPHAIGIDAFRDLAVPSGQVLMVSFPIQSVGRSRPPEYRGRSEHEVVNIRYAREVSTITLSEIPKGSSHRIPYMWQGTTFPPRVFNSSIRVHFSTVLDTSLGFKMLFSFHPEHEAPPVVAGGLFDCSVPHYANFKQHVHCNLEPECQGGQDERHCPFHHPACNGSVGYGTKCFTLIAWHKRLTWTEAERACQVRGGSLARLKSFGQWQAVSHIFSYGIRRSLFYVGARKLEEVVMPNEYKKLWMWTDHTVAYSVKNRGGNGTCLFCGYYKIARCGTVDCQTVDLTTNFICESNNTVSTKKGLPTIERPTRPFPEKKTTCSSGHVTHAFLSCEADSQCGLHLSVTSCSVPGKGSVSKFSCQDDKHLVHYSLVCDYRNDCPDASDERFCVHDNSLCPDQTCRNSQCLRFDHWCDGMHHCVDSTDERFCSRDRKLWLFLRPSYIYDREDYEDLAVFPKMVVDLDGHGDANFTSLGPSASCPETHFRCPADQGYCLPVYMRCNGMDDCPDHEDEAECDSYTCPGLYRCRASTVCLHPKYMCDGVFQCPKQDDEWMCSRNDTCPAGCHCHGLAFVCSSRFAADMYPDLRFLDASQSGVTLQDLTAGHYLVCLVLSRNNLTAFPEVSLPNLLYLDVSDNHIPTVCVDVFLGLSNLRILRISNNPLMSFRVSKLGIRHESLKTLDMAHSKLVDFDSKVLSGFPKLTELNMSYSTLRTIGVNGLKYLPSLTTLDLQASPVEFFPMDVFSQLNRLQSIRSDNYKLCCRQILPKYVKDEQCLAPVSEVSSCEDLLRTDVFRTALWVCAAMSLSGNAGCLLFRLFVRRARSQSAFDVFVTNLCVADFTMGVYLVLIGTIDLLLRGEYLHYETRWKRHVACKTAGFLSLLSSEVSAFIICLITLDRFIKLRFPFSVFQFGRWSGAIVCCLVWTLGVCLAGLPLLPMMSHWMFYGQTGICIPLPVTRRYFAGLHYAFGVLIVLNFVLFVLVAAGQVSIYWSVQSVTMETSTRRRSQEMTIARRLFSVAVSDFLCWFPIGLVGMLANRGIPIPGQVNVGLAIFVLPLNSALNPFLYTFNMVMEKRRRAEEARTLRLMETELPIRADVIAFRLSP